MGLTKIGFISWGAALVVLLFQGVSGLMQMTASWSKITLGSLTNEVLDQFIKKIPSEAVVGWVDFIVNTMELSILLGIVGLICIIIGAFKKV
ncbi:MAG: hypothetical protein KAJ62_06385 [Desulfobacteraceae bacterium]|nr:hypothetical protein [Desulfobacteraceae bacterium]